MAAASSPARRSRRSSAARSGTRSTSTRSAAPVSAAMAAGRISSSATMAAARARADAARRAATSAAFAWRSRSARLRSARSRAAARSARRTATVSASSPRRRSISWWVAVSCSARAATASRRSASVTASACPAVARSVSRACSSRAAARRSALRSSSRPAASAARIASRSRRPASSAVRVAAATVSRAARSCSSACCSAAAAVANASSAARASPAACGGVGGRLVALTAQRQHHGAGAAGAEGEAAVGVDATAVARDGDAARDERQLGRVVDEVDALEQTRRSTGSQRHEIGQRPAALGRRAAAEAVEAEQRGAGQVGVVEQCDGVGGGRCDGLAGAPGERRGDGGLEALAGLDQVERQLHASLAQAAHGGRQPVAAVERTVGGLGAGGGGLRAAGGGAARTRERSRSRSRTDSAVVRAAAAAAWAAASAAVAAVASASAAASAASSPARDAARAAASATRASARAPAASACSDRLADVVRGAVGAAVDLGQLLPGGQRRVERAGDLAHQRGQGLLARGVVGGGQRGGVRVGLGGGAGLLGPCGDDLGVEPVGPRQRPAAILGQRRQPLGQRLAARGQAVEAAGQAPVPLGRTLLLADQPGQLALDRLALGGRDGDGGVEPGALGADLLEIGGDARAQPPGGGDLRRRELDARGVDLAGQRRGALGGRGLQGERPEPRLQLGLEVAGAREVGLDPRQLARRPVAAALVLAEPGRLLDEAAPVGRARQQDLVDAALRDDRVQLAAEAGVGQRLLHVEPPHRRCGSAGTGRRRHGAAGA